MAFVAVLVFLFSPAVPVHRDAAPENRVKMEKGGGKNGKHANGKAREAAAEKAEKIKEELDMLQKKIGVKSPEDKALIQKLQDQLAHWRRKAQWKGEHHSQKGKGN